MESARPPLRDRGRRQELVRRASAAATIADMFAAASRSLRALVGHDASAWLTTDPETGLPTAPTRIEGVAATAEECSAHWHHEFVEPDANLFRDLSRAEVPAAALRHTIPDPERSARYRRFLRPREFTDELRAVLRVGSTVWGTVTLWRSEGKEPFSRAEAATLAALSGPLGGVLQVRARGQAPPAAPSVVPDRPGLLVFDTFGNLASADAQAGYWLEQFPPDDMVSTRLGVRVPIWLLLTVIRARESGRLGGGAASSRVRSVSRRWLICHASTTIARDGSPAETVVVIEPASPSLMAPILVEAYGLTDREQEVTRLIARGAGTEEIARALYLSPYTVKDHVSAILGKVGVATRGELVATLFADLYEPTHLSG